MILCLKLKLITAEIGLGLVQVKFWPQSTHMKIISFGLIRLAIWVVLGYYMDRTCVKIKFNPFWVKIGCNSGKFVKMV